MHCILATKGRSLLQSMLAVTPRTMTVVELAKRLGVGRDSIYAWARGSRRPEAHLRLALERLVGIPAIAWMTDDERVAAFGADGAPDPSRAA